MPFSLKNVGATYQRLVNHMFSKEIGKTMQIKREDHLAHLARTFEILRKFNMRLNPKKCNFGVEFGKFLGHMVRRRGIEENPSKLRQSSIWVLYEVLRRFRS